MEEPKKPREELGEMPDYFGTGRQPRREENHYTLRTILLLVLLGANLVTIAIYLGMQQGKKTWAETLQGSRELILSLKENLSDRKEVTAFTPGGKRLDREELYAQVSEGMTQIVAQAPGYAQTGIGVILTTDGYILTNSHIIEDADALSVTLSDGRERTALYVGADEQTDLAVLKIEEDDLTPAVLGNVSGITPGESLYLLGSMKEEALKATTLTELKDETFHGAVINQWGQIIYFGRENGNPVSMQEAGTLACELIQYGCVSRQTDLGLQVSDLEEVERRYWELPEGVVIDQAAINGSGYLAGLRAGDLITAVGGVPIRNTQDFHQAVEDCDGSMTVEYYRKGQEYQVEITP